MVAWFVKAFVFHSVNLAPSANGSLNPAVAYMNVNMINSDVYQRVKSVLCDPASFHCGFVSLKKF